MKTYSFIPFILLLLPTLLLAERQEYRDSLEKELLVTHNIENKTEIYFLLSRSYLHTDISEAYAYGLEALNLVNKVKSQDISGKVYSQLGDILVNMDSLNQAKNYYQLALTIYEKQNNAERIVILVTVLGNIAYVQDNYSDALQYYRRGISLAKQNNYLKRLNKLYLNIGSVYSEGEQFLESQEYYSKSLIYFLNSGDSIDAAIAYKNLGTTYLNLGDESTAKDYFKKSLELFSLKNAFISEANVLIDLSQIEFIANNYDESKKLLIKSTNIFEKNTAEQFEGSKNVFLSMAYISLGKTYFHLQEIDSAEFYARKGLQISLQLSQLRETSKASELLVAIWQNRKNADSAFYYHVLFKKYSDSLFSQKNNRNLAYQQAQFSYQQATEKAELTRQKEAEKHNRNMLMLVATVILLVLIIAVLGLFFQLNRTKMKKTEIEQQNLKKEIDLKNKELTTYLMYQVKNNEFIVNISKKLKTLLWKGTTENKSMVNEIIREIETDSSSDNWDEFIVRFQQVHTGFYKNLGKNYPELTSNELRLCAFLKLNMNTKDIAAITYQSQKSITVARWRLRQKLGLKKEERLSAFLSKF